MTLTTYLAAEPAPWSEVAGSYDLDYGHLVAPPNRLQRRGNILDWAKGNIDIDKSVDFDANWGEPNKKQTLWHDDTQVSHFPRLLI